MCDMCVVVSCVERLCNDGWLFFFYVWGVGLWRIEMGMDR